MKTFIVAVLLLAVCLTGPAMAGVPPKPTQKPNPKPNVGVPAFNIPGFGNFPGFTMPMPGFQGGNGGFGYAYSGPKGSYAKGGSFTGSTTCKEKNCYNKKLTCPAKCSHSYTRVGKGYAGGGGGGGCTFDCKKCLAYC